MWEGHAPLHGRWLGLGAASRLEKSNMPGFDTVGALLFSFVCIMRCFTQFVSFNSSPPGTARKKRAAAQIASEFECA